MQVGFQLTAFLTINLEWIFYDIVGRTIKVVICGKYKNLNKITKIEHISLKFQRLLIFVILHSLQCKIEGHAV